MSSFTKREQIVILVIVFTIILMVGFKFLIKDIIGVGEETISVVNSDVILESKESDEILEEGQIIMVHISGQVYNPGIIEIELGKRLNDAIKLAGGLKKDADIDRINLAKKLADEEKVYIPKIGEEIPNEILSISSSDRQEQSGKTNINTCTKEELINLPGIGEAIAERIMEYRLTTPFKSIDDIKNVSGIGDKKFDALKELITVK